MLTMAKIFSCGITHRPYSLKYSKHGDGYFELLVQKDTEKWFVFLKR